MSQFCQNCGKGLMPDAKFCKECGAAVQSQPSRAQAPPPSDAFASAPSANKRKAPPKKRLLSAVAVILVAAVALGILPQLFGGKYPFEKGASVEQSVKADKNVTVGDLKKTGWRLELPEETFPQDGKLTMKVLSEAEAQRYQSDDFIFYGTPVELAFDEREHTLLGAPVSVTLQIPKDLMKDLAAEELFFATYYDGQWEYLLPDSVDLDKGTATVALYHFSFWGFGRPSEAKQIETYAQNMAALQWQRDNQSKKLRDALSRQFDDLFASMNIESESVRGQLAADVISALEDGLLETGGVAPLDALAQMANAASKGDSSAFQNKFLEFTGKAICHVMEKDTEKFASYANLLGGLGTAAGAMSEGDTDGALQGVADILKGLNPMVALADSALIFVKEQMENTIDIWSQNELEKAYQVYIGGAAGKWGAYSGLDGDIDSIFMTMGGGERAFNMKVVKKYCEKYGINEKNLSQSERDKIISDAKTALKRKFDEREASEAGIAEIKVKEEAFIAALKEEGLLSPLYYQKFFGLGKRDKVDIGERLAKLYSLRSLVLGYVDKDKVETLTDKQIAILIRQWIFYSQEKDRAAFFKYLRDSGYIVEPLKKDPTFAWVLETAVTYDRKKEIEESNKSRAGTYSFSASSAQGSYSYTWTYVGKGDTWYDPDLIHGENSTSECTWTVPPPTIQGGETVTLSLKLNFGSQMLSFFGDSAYASADFDKWDVEPGFITAGAIRFKNKDGKDSFAIDYSKNILSLSETVTAEAPIGREEGDKIALRTLFNGSRQGTCYIYVWKQVG